jgi:crotonobetaine/carnitine-CoA ligase
MPAATALPFPRLHPFVGRDVPWLLRSRAATHGDRPYLVWSPFEGEGLTYTYRQFAAAVERCAAGLAARGLRKGDFFLIHLNNCAEFLVAWHACSRLGGVAVTTNTRSSPEELAYYAENCGAVAALTQPALVDLVRASAPKLRFLAVTATDQGAPAAAFPAAGTVRWGDVDEDPSTLPTETHDPLHFNSVQYTSGTTARPKGVVWTHANVLWGARLTATLLKLTPDDVGLVFFPLFHTNALMYSSLGSLWGGGSVVVTPRYSASRFWNKALAHRCTWACSSPFMLKTLATHPVPDRHWFRFWGSGTTDPPLARDLFRVQGLGWFGMTETISFPTIGHLDLPNRPLGMGCPTPGYEVRVARDDGTDVAFGETGRLLVRGVPGLSLFYEYLNNPEATAAAFDAEGWMETGDQVTPHADGHLRFEGRGKDMLRVGAENVAAAEIERVIQAVAGVFEVAVVAQPHALLGDVPAAFVIPEGDPRGLDQAILAACRAQLADFKVPRAVIFVAEFPRSTLNKVSKKDLRARLATGEGEA